MPGAIFAVAMCKRRDDGWHHPRSDQACGEYRGVDKFVLEAVDVDDGQALATFYMERDCLEQIMENAKRALTIPPVRIHRANS